MQRSLISLIVGGILALLAVGGLTYYLRSQSQPPSVGTTIETGNVVVAVGDLPFGTQLSRDHGVMACPVASMPADAFHSVEEVFAGSQGFDRIVLKPVDKGEPLLKSRISGFGAKATLSRQVPPGMRAVSIRVDDVSGVAGFILPGDRVDVMLTRRLEGTTPDTNLATDIILQNILVLGIDQLSDQDRETGRRSRLPSRSRPKRRRNSRSRSRQVRSACLRNATSVDQVPSERVVNAICPRRLRLERRPVQRDKKVQTSMAEGERRRGARSRLLRCSEFGALVFMR
jgi:Flp pilus assembly protein CpaB